MNVIPGQQYYENRPNVSISPNGGGAQPAPAQPASQPASQPVAPQPEPQPYPAPTTIAAVQPQPSNNIAAEQPTSLVPPVPQLPSIQNPIAPAPLVATSAPTAEAPQSAAQPAVNPTTIVPATTSSSVPAPQVQPTQSATVPQVEPTKLAAAPHAEPVVPQAHKKKCKKHKSTTN
ncbi:hypothetical protein CONCODRAFT_72599 [Conidiobolus coronatus NRRL 28638]|uniref:Uncharacterized protein n=1 Tax=Conidiobolus coronatus (strain ATCC 28846 / CBS 209.66 / NRRL 28638) TaxID=796925 RepID=A0A137NZ12_CONC2|nr:hypothetical protein CONCODRAFT_72599 [Conidiobolus coronatus NRRL 28638]|eukprot:KXN67938.1 hypothetical protein CONCODRAFT_72599 [Conidiobolus coronatus NRRL 28638]